MKLPAPEKSLPPETSLSLVTTAAILGALVAGGIGVLYGAVAGYAGGRADSLMMRTVEILYGFPYVILVILLSLLLGGGNFALFAAIVFTLWLTPAVIVPVWNVVITAPLVSVGE